MKLKKRLIFGLIGISISAFLIIIISLNRLYDDNFYSLNARAKKRLPIVPNSKDTLNSSLKIEKPTILVVEEIKQKLDEKLAKGFGRELDSIAQNEVHNLRSLIDRLKADLRDPRPKMQIRRKPSFKAIWKIAEEWVSARELIPDPAPELGLILRAMAEAAVVKTDVARKGTQLKLTLTLQDGQSVLFKPKRYSREEIIKGPPYAGADRHNGEIVAFHLSRLLNMRFVPITVGRRLHVAAEIKRYASPSLASTFITKGNHSGYCFFGECYYCSESDPVCPDEDGFLEGAIVLMLPERYALKKLRHPYQRTYKQGVRASWEVDKKYCDNNVRGRNYLGRVLDLIDVAIFDFLIGNADRHHYEVFKDVPNSCVLLIDNGKSFGNPYVDELTILAPLYNCCVIRKSTYQRLMLFAKSGSLSQAIQELTIDDPLSPLLTIAHYRSLDRRMKTVLEVISLCIDEYSEKTVLIKN